MPGEKPSSVWKPRFYRPEYHLRRRWFRLPSISLRRIVQVLFLASIFLAARQIWLATATHIIVLVNGQPVEVSTHRRTVAGAVRLAGITLDDTIYVEPGADTPLLEGMVITLGSMRPVIVHTDGQILIAHTHQVDPKLIVAELGIPLNPGDAVRVDRALSPSSEEIEAHPALKDAPALPREITISRVQTVIVHEIDAFNGTQTDVSFQTTAPMLGRALIDAGYSLYVADNITPGIETPITGMIEVTIDRAAPVTVQADGQTLPTRTHEATVTGLLSEMGLALNGDDYVIPAPSALIPSGGTVQIVRVHSEETNEDVPIPFDTVYAPDPDMLLDQQRVVDPGEAGTLSRRVRRRFEDGKIVSEALIGEYTSRQPRAQVVAYGTHILIQTVDTSYGPLRYWRKLHVLATSYSPSTAGSKRPGDPFFGLSATGAEVVRGIVATDPRVIPLGTNLYVPKYGLGQALDVGGAVKGFRVDLGYDDANLVLWNTWVDIYLIVPVPPPNEMVWVLPGN